MEHLFEAETPGDGASCVFCASAAPGGQLILREEVRHPQRPWSDGRVLADARLCPGCFEWADGLVQRIIAQDLATQMMLGVPSSAGVRAQDLAACEYCGVGLAGQSFNVEMVPTRRYLVGRMVSRRVGTAKQNRICHQCHVWWRTTLEDSSSLKGTSFRALEGTSGGWRGDLAFDTRSVFVSAKDQFVLRSTVEAMGHDYAAVRSVDVTRRPDAATSALFVGAGRLSRATQLLSSLSSDVGARTVVVAQNDSLNDGLGALRAGATDLLASPLSPQQVAGAFERIAHPLADMTYDPDTGLAVFTAPIPGYGLNCYFLEISHPHMSPPATYLLLRRFLRGYDRVGLTEAGRAGVLVYCEDRHIANVMLRLRFILGERAEVRQLGQVESEPKPDSSRVPTGVGR